MRIGILTHHWSKWFLARGLEVVRNKRLKRMRHSTDRLLSRRVCEVIIAVIMQENPGEGLGNHFSQRTLSSEIEESHALSSGTMAVTPSLEVGVFGNVRWSIP